MTYSKLKTPVLLSESTVDFKTFQNQLVHLWNNDFGFQPPFSITDTIAFAYIQDENDRYDPEHQDPIMKYNLASEELSEEMIEKINTMAGTKTVESASFIGRPYLRIDWREYEFIPTVLTSMLKNGIAFSTQTSPGVAFNPECDQRFSWRTFECRFVNEWTKYTHPNVYQTGSPESMFKPFNYETKEGREFAIRICGLGKKSVPTEESNHWRLPLFKDKKRSDFFLESLL